MKELCSFMRQGIFILALELVFIINIQAQEVRRNVVTTNMLNFLFNTQDIQYERRFEKRALRLSVAYTDNHYFLNTIMDGWMTTLDYKIYINPGQVGYKSYVAPYLRFQNMYFEGPVDAVRVNTLGGGVLYGRVFRLFRLDWLTLDLHGGINYIPEGYKLLAGSSPPNIDLPLTSYKVGGRFGLSLGVAF